MSFEIVIKDNIEYTVRHMAGGDLVSIKAPYSAKPVRGFIRKIMAVEHEIRKSA